MTPFRMKACQFSIALFVVMASIYAAETIPYPINPFIIGAWAFMAAYGFTLAYINLSDRRVRTGRILPRFRSKKAPTKGLDI